jgi:hypothetical protein
VPQGRNLQHMLRIELQIAVGTRFDTTNQDPRELGLIVEFSGASPVALSYSSSKG